ncbi:MAG TPA: sulfatase [Phycisphaerales bacterium]|nr:sulfatase [Phycisphaerales bacterium]
MPQPNIVLILMDDLGWVDIGCYGSSFYETPALDLLARQGMRFTDAYAACPVCSPTRASLLTGKYPATVRITNYIPGAAKGRLLSAPYLHYLPLTEKTIASALRDGGYATWHVGKWHLGAEPYWPEKHGFDVNIGGCDWGHPKKGYFSPWGIATLPDGPQGQYLPDRLADDAIALIRNRDKSKPFFLNYWDYLVHTPVQGKPELVEKYRAKATALGLDARQHYEDGEFFPCEHKKNQRVRRRLLQGDPGYAAMVQSMDENLGRILATLEEEGIADETIVLFTSDNGGLSTAEGSPTCNAPLAEGKGWMYEGGTREPLIVRWPGVTKADSVCAEAVTSPDFYPTLLEAAGLPPMPRQHVDGVSLVPLLAGRGGLDREAIFWHYPHYGNQGGTPGCSVRSGDWKLIEFFEDRRVELYNLRQDVGEDRDLSREQPEIAERLRKRLHQWLRDVDAQIPQPNPDYAP